jgi:hypothetical protein
METSGRPTEGWMTLVPLIVLVSFVMLALGGPVATMNFIASWARDIIDYLLAFIKGL